MDGLDDRRTAATRVAGRGGDGSRALLVPGDLVGVVSTGFAVRASALAAGIRDLSRRGLRVRIGRRVLFRRGYLAGSDAERAADLNSMLRDPEVRAIFFSRGGYGTSRILDSVDWNALRRYPKLLVGYSDLTALFAPAIDRTGAACLYGPVVSELGDRAAFHAPSLRRVLSGRPVAFRIARSQVLVRGTAQGRLVGGNLTVLTHLVGTRYAPDLAGRVVFLEEVGEEVYRIDRMLLQLRASGALDRAAAIVLGHFSAPRRKSFPPDRRLDDVFREVFNPLGIPVVGGIPVGHRANKRAIPLGTMTRVDTRAGRLEIEPLRIVDSRSRRG